MHTAGSVPHTQQKSELKKQKIIFKSKTPDNINFAMEESINIHMTKKSWNNTQTMQTFSSE